jgi:Flp pilus assembly protein TadG
MVSHRAERGNQTVEFTLVGLPLTIILFSIANMSFSMLTMHTIQEAVEQGARYAATRGSTCSSGTNTCSATVEQIATVIASAAAGVSSSILNVTFTPAADTANAISCAPLSHCMAGCGGNCVSGYSSTWPTSANNDNSPGKDIIISATCTVSAPMLMFWPSSGVTKNIASTTFQASSRQRLMF